MAQIGFIGLGNMGLPMAINLLKAGHALQVFDLAPAALDAAVAAGASAAADVASAVDGVDAVVTMLPAGKHVKSVYLDDGGVLQTVRPGTLLIDSSTIDVATAREVSAAAKERGLDMLDAPVSGGVKGAEAGALAFMVGGPEEAFARAADILDPMAAKVIHAGAAGSGQAAKICNNMLLAISMIGTSEAFALGRRLGLADQALFDIAAASSGQCWSLTSYCPVPGPVPTSPANNNYQAGFAVDLMLKDIGLSQDAARDAGLVTPLAAKAESIYAELSESGHGALDFSGVFPRINGDL